MLTRLTLTEASALLRMRKVSPVELTKACLERIQKLDPSLHAFITVMADSALKQAHAAESEIGAGRWRGPLHGIPLALKDLIDTAGVPTTAGSALFQSRVPQQDAEVVQRLKAAGAVLLGKLNLHELAYGGSGVLSAFGVARNPWSLDRITGGSSSGAAAAVAAQMCFGALGTDTAGSVRMPAALCGIAGLKASYGLVSTRGVLPLSWSLDHVGPMTRSVADSAVLLQAIAGYDAGDVASREFPPEEHETVLAGNASELRIGLPSEYFFSDLDSDVEAAVNRAAETLRDLGHELQDIELAVDPDRTVQAAEAYAVYAPILDECSRHCHPQTLKRIASGAGVTAAEYIAKKRDLEYSRRLAERIFSRVDVLLTPTAPVPASRVAELESDLSALRTHELLLLRNTRPFNVLGLPAISVPCGFTKGGLPVGLQIVGPPGGDARVLSLAHAYEQATEWHKRLPDSL